MVAHFKKKKNLPLRHPNSCSVFITTVTGVPQRPKSLQSFALLQQTYVKFWWTSLRKHWTQRSSIYTKSSRGFKLWSSCDPTVGQIQRSHVQTKAVTNAARFRWWSEPNVQRTPGGREHTTCLTEKDDDPWDDAFACWWCSLHFFAVSTARGSLESTEAFSFFFYNMSRIPGKLHVSTKKLESVSLYSIWACP